LEKAGAKGLSQGSATHEVSKMSAVVPRFTVLSGGSEAASLPRSQLVTAYEHFRLERQGNLVSENTLENYDALVKPFLTGPATRVLHASPDLDIGAMRTYRADPATAISPNGHTRMQQ
jgi:hypothetical protein